MQEALLIVPNADNDGASLAALRDSIASQMCDAFGGVTENDAQGLWKDDSGKVYSEPVTRLVSAADDTQANVAELESLARQVLHDGKQKAVYLRLPNGQVEIIESKESRS
jgi:hypothetical protein